MKPTADQINENKINWDLIKKELPGKNKVRLNLRDRNTDEPLIATSLMYQNIDIELVTKKGNKNNCNLKEGEIYGTFLYKIEEDYISSGNYEGVNFSEPEFFTELLRLIVLIKGMKRSARTMHDSMNYDNIFNLMVCK